jgi:hypothetical protein
MPVLDRVLGRTSDKLVLADGSEVMATTVLAIVAKRAGGVRAYQGRQSRAGELDLLLSVEDTFDESTERRLERELVETFRLERVRIKRTDSIEPGPGGKARPFVSEIME